MFTPPIQYDFFVNDLALNTLKIRVYADDNIDLYSYEMTVSDKSFNDSWVFTDISTENNNVLVVKIEADFDLHLNESPLLYQIHCINDTNDVTLLFHGRLYVTESLLRE